jgi:hypothetical protein
MEQAAGEDVTRLAEEVGATLRRVLAESPQMAQLRSRVRAEGYDFSVVLDATIGFTRAEPQRDDVPALNVRVEKASAPPATGLAAAPPLRMTPLDRKFLRSLKITVEEDEE